MPGRNRSWAFWRRPLHANWIQQQIDATAEAQAAELQRIEARFDEVCRDIENRGRDMVRHVEVRTIASARDAQHQLNALKLLTEQRLQDSIRAHAQNVADAATANDLRLRRLLEERTQIAADEAKAYSDHRLENAIAQYAQRAADEASGYDRKLRHLIEERGQVAAGEAKAYADHSVGGLSKSVAASGRVIAGALKRLQVAEDAIAQAAALADRIDALSQAIETTAQEGSETLQGLLGDAAAAKIEFAARCGAIEREIAQLAQDDSARLQAEQALTQVADMAAHVDAVSQRLETAIAAEREALAVLTNNATETKGELAARCAALERKVGEIVQDYNTQLRNAEHRIEFVRSETMYEMQATKFKAEEVSVPARIVAPEKIEQMRASGLKLNIGCGHIQMDGYINVDRRELPGIDVVADVFGLPFAENELAEVRSAYLVEHFSSHILERVLLPHWRSLLKPGGVLTTIAPDGAAMLAAVNSGEMTFEDFREVLFGGQEYDGDFHYNLITPDTFREYLLRAGFRDVTEVYVGRRNGKCFEFQISAQKV